MTMDETRAKDGASNLRKAECAMSVKKKLARVIRNLRKLNGRLPTSKAAFA